jgi:hypothetical protein
MANVRLAEAESAVEEALATLVRDGDEGSFLIVSVGEVYVQFGGDRNPRSLIWEAVGDKFLPAAKRPEPERTRELERLGFRPQRPGNWSQIVPFADDGTLSRLARESVRILAEVYRCPPDAHVSMELELG